MQDELMEISAEAPVPPGTPIIGFGSRAARGFASTLTSTIIVKVVMFAGNIVVAWYLSEGELGLAATAIAASIFPAQIKEFGITQLLLRHPRRFEQWSADAAWLTTVLGIASGLVIALLAPIVALATHSPAVMGPFLLMALNAFLSGPPTVPFTKLAIDLKFVLVARLTTAVSIISTALSIAMAILRWGPYAVVLPIVIASFLRLAIGCSLAPVPWFRRPHWSRCRVMLGDGWKMLLSLFFFQIVWQCDYLILGIIHTQDDVGVYYFAFQLASQALTLLSQNLAGVLLPVLGHMSGDPTRQRDGFLRAARILCALGIPLCFLQAALADPLVRLIWHDKWIAAVPAIQALSIGTAFRLLGYPASSLLFAQGRLNTYLISSICSSMAFLVVVTMAAHFGAVTSVAIAVAIFYMIMETSIASVSLGNNMQSKVRFFESGFAAVRPVLSTPLAAGAVGGAAAYAVAEAVMRSAGPLPALFAGGAAGAVVTLLVMSLISSELPRELLSLFRSVTARQNVS